MELRAARARRSWSETQVGRDGRSTGGASRAQMPGVVGELLSERQLPVHPWWLRVSSTGIGYTARNKNYDVICVERYPRVGPGRATRVVGQRAVLLRSHRREADARTVSAGVSAVRTTLRRVTVLPWFSGLPTRTERRRWSYHRPRSVLDPGRRRIRALAGERITSGTQRSKCGGCTRPLAQRLVYW